MTESQSASPLLTELRRLSAAQDALILLPTPMLDMSVSSIGTDPMATMATVEMQGQITSAIAAASDAELVQAYQQTNRDPNALDVDLLLHEIERRNLDR